MKILVTGAKGFVGRNLVENLKNIRDGKNRTRPQLRIEEIYEYDQENTLDDLDRFCSACDFVFNLAGVNLSLIHIYFRTRDRAAFCGFHHAAFSKEHIGARGVLLFADLRQDGRPKELYRTISERHQVFHQGAEALSAA